MSGPSLRKRTQRLRNPFDQFPAGFQPVSSASETYSPPRGPKGGVLPGLDDDEDRTLADPSQYASTFGQNTREDAAGKSVDDSWFDLPIAFALIPAVGSLLTGSDILKDFLHLAFLLYYLHTLIKWPWILYDASRRRLPAIQTVQPSTEEAKRVVNIARSELRVAELLYLSFTVIAPFLGAALLRQVSPYLSIDVISNFSVSLFVLATGVKPWRHLIRILIDRTESLHTMVHYPPPTNSGLNDPDSSSALALEHRIIQIESDMNSLSCRLASAASDITALAVTVASLTNVVQPTCLPSEQLVTRADLMAAVGETTKEAIALEHSRISLELRLHRLEEGVTGLAETLGQLQRNAHRLQVDQATDYPREHVHGGQILHRLSFILFGPSPIPPRNRRLTEKKKGTDAPELGRNEVVYEADQDEGDIAVHPVCHSDMSDAEMEDNGTHDDVPPVSSTADTDVFSPGRRQDRKRTRRRADGLVWPQQQRGGGHRDDEEIFGRALLNILVDNVVVAILLPLRLIRTSATMVLGRLR